MLNRPAKRQTCKRYRARVTILVCQTQFDEFDNKSYRAWAVLLLNNVDMKHSSSKEWELIKKLDCDPTKPRTRTLLVTANPNGTSATHKWKNKKKTSTKT